jgi:hypothetical protein
VLTTLARWAVGVVAGLARRLHSAVRGATRPASLVVGFVEDAFRSREELIVENRVAKRTVQKASSSRRDCRRPRPGAVW